MGKGGSSPSIVNRMDYLLTIYEQPELDHVFNVVSKDAVTVIATEMSYMKMKNEKDDNDETAKKVILAIVDELADRIKTEVRYRISLMKDEEKKK